MCEKCEKENKRPMTNINVLGFMAILFGCYALGVIAGQIKQPVFGFVAGALIGVLIVKLCQALARREIRLFMALCEAMRRLGYKEGDAFVVEVNKRV
jgi:ABC-type Co2+ transport system permease subunit